VAELSGDVAAVTGGGSGIGRAIAKGLAHAGAIVCVLDIDKAGADETARLIAASGGRGFAVACDASDEDSVLAAERVVAGTFGPASILVNNAGILRAKPLDQLTLADWNSVLAVNLTGYFLCARIFGKAMCARGKGSIVHVGSIASSFAQTRGGAYSAAKAGVCGLSSTIAAEWGPFGVRSNVVHPGMIRTALSAPFYADPELARRREATVASRRTGVPEDVAQVACFLASERSSYVNGAELTVDGGFSRMAIDLVPRPGYEPR
jgi:NAD(P)-dependent dehydrogenase (short-subunit alcohol dehydrogenase family)